jgi:transposase
MSERTRFVGLDVHKASITVAVAEAFGDPEDHGHIGNDPSAVRRLVQRLGGPDLHLEVAYEAGPTGYALYRQLTAMVTSPAPGICGGPLARARPNRRPVTEA